MDKDLKFVIIYILIMSILAFMVAKLLPHDECETDYECEMENEVAAYWYENIVR
jgi:hypothetical protein